MFLIRSEFKGIYSYSQCLISKEDFDERWLRPLSERGASLIPECGTSPWPETIECEVDWLVDFLELSIAGALK